MRHLNRRIRGLAAVGLLAVAGIAGFMLSGNSANGATQSKGTVSLRTTKLGKILVSSNGHALYLFAKDKGGRSACTGMCATYWPPLTSAAKPTAGAGVKVALLGRTRRSDGKMQVTYNKHPLYWFSGDKSAGQVTGEELKAFGGEWYAVSAKGAKVEKSGESGGGGATTTSPTPTYTYTQPIPGY
jgi:predicted lipoprotein with Yx(FWY)xxD motif